MTLLLALALWVPPPPGALLPPPGYCEPAWAPPAYCDGVGPPIGVIQPPPRPGAGKPSIRILHALAEHRSASRSNHR
jgi:hypothetical protein